MTVVGVLGGGQLGRMLALAGHPLGLRCRVLDPSLEAPAGEVAELIVGAYDDDTALEQLARGATAVTYEFENVPAATARELGRHGSVWPPPAALETAQDRLAEKSLFERLEVPTSRFAAADNPTEVACAVERVGLPAVAKTRRLGYDGKGQLVLRGGEDVERAWRALGGVPLLVESLVAFNREVSLLAVRGRDGSTRCYPLVENHHRDGILRLSLAPAPGRERIQEKAASYAVRMLDALNYVGVLAIELFQVGDELLANEIAPRVHNSGHWTIEGAESSQFENHLRAILGWPLGSTEPVGYSAMVNLIGALPDPATVLAVPGAHLHLYGKVPRPGRKLGHVTITAAEPEERDKRLARLLEALGEELTSLRG